MQPADGSGGGAKEELGQEAPVRLKRMNADLPEELHIRFKTACARRGEQMTVILRKLIEDWTRNNE